MFKVERATTKDFERVYPQLQKFNSAELSKEDWKRLFVNYWKSPEDFCGHILVKDGAVKGFLGLIFSNRIYNGEVHKFCNLTSWIVDEDCRNQSVFLLLEALKLKDYTFTNFTASQTVAVLVKRLGFEEFEVNQQIIPPIPKFALKKRACACEFDLQKIRSDLNVNEQTIFDDHQQLDCRHLLLKSNDGYAYVILKKTHRRNIPIAKVHYISDAGYFVECAEKFVVKICLRLKVLGVMVDERYLGGYRLRRSIRYPQQRKGYFKSNSKTLNKNQIDTLYSELVVLFNPKVAS